MLGGDEAQSVAGRGFEPTRTSEVGPQSVQTGAPLVIDGSAFDRAALNKPILYDRENSNPPSADHQPEGLVGKAVRVFGRENKLCASNGLG
jgi:hypothetical protein